MLLSACKKYILRCALVTYPVELKMWRTARLQIDADEVVQINYVVCISLNQKGFNILKYFIFNGAYICVYVGICEHVSMCIHVYVSTCIHVYVSMYICVWCLRESEMSDPLGLGL